MSGAPVSGIVTPEAVVLDLPAAGVASRAIAKTLDVFLSGVVLAVLEAGWRSVFDGFYSEVLFGIALTILVIVPALLEWRFLGRTPGKAILGLRVVTLDGGPVSLRHCLIRGVAQILDVVMGLAIFPALVTRRSQRIGDLMAGTFVCAERSSTYGSTPIAFYPLPGWEPYMSVLDVGRITDEQYRLIRNVLVRSNAMGDGPRTKLLADVARAVKGRVAPDPGDVVDKDFLVCVAAAYQMRNGGLVQAHELKRPFWVAGK